MQRFNKKLSIHRRVEGDLSPSGEAEETWPVISGGSNVSCCFQPLSVGAAAALSGSDPGQILRSSHSVLFQKGTDVQGDDRLLDSDGNYYVVQYVEDWTRHLRVTVGIAGRET